ncbi:MAG TPA: hypothetical protein VN132_14165 [Bdellovibrio sp.]|nr:hypothetical protein [Bdellovibrio sp.]
MDSGEIDTQCVFGDHRENCRFDSGSEATDVTESPSFMKFPSEGKATQGGASGISINCNWITVPSFTGADIELKMHQVKRCPISRSVLGIEAFQGSTLLDFDNRLLISSQVPLDNTAQETRFTLAPMGQIILPLTFMGQIDAGVWDTGAALTSVDLNFLKEHSNQFSFLQDIDGGTDYTGKPVTIKLYQVESITVAGVEFKNLKVLAFDFSNVRAGVGHDTHFILGYNIIRKMNWMIDLRTRRWKATAVEK